MKIMKKNIAIIFIAATLFGATGVYAQQTLTQTQTQTLTQTQTQLRASLIKRLYALLSQLIEQHQEKLAQENLVKELEDGTVKSEEINTRPPQRSENIMTSQKTISVSGDNNDYAEFKIEFDLNSFGRDAYISENSQAFNYSILNANTGSVVYDSDGTQNGNSISSVSSLADVDNSFYRLDRGDESQTFVFTATYNPHTGLGTPPGVGSYRMRLDSVEYSFAPGGSVQLYNSGNNQRFRTSPSNIIN